MPIHQLAPYFNLIYWLATILSIAEQLTIIKGPLIYFISGPFKNHMS
jgi:hypothetical protein